MKRLMVFGLALMLATSAGVAQAGRGNDKHYRGHGHAYDHGHKHGHHKGHGRPGPYYRDVHHAPHYTPHHAPHHGHHGDYFAPLGAALIGAAVTYSLIHAHDTRPVASGPAQVVGCHRVERYPDGGERRVEVPIAECY